MKRPPLELADIIAAVGHRLIDHPPAWFTWLHLKVLDAITVDGGAVLRIQYVAPQDTRRLLTIGAS
jgi:hypothetical protein